MIDEIGKGLLSYSRLIVADDDDDWIKLQSLSASEEISKKYIVSYSENTCIVNVCPICDLYH